MTVGPSEGVNARAGLDHIWVLDGRSVSVWKARTGTIPRHRVLSGPLSQGLPPPQAYSREAPVAKAQAEADRAVAARDQVRADVLRDVASAWREYEAATRNLKTATAVQADAQEQLRLVTLRETAGKAIEVEVLDALFVTPRTRDRRPQHRSL